MDYALRHVSANPGRSGHAMALAAQAVVDDARRQVAELFNAPDPSRLIFALNCTDLTILGWEMPASWFER